MSIENTLENNARIYNDEMEFYYQNPDVFSEMDILEFTRAATRRDVAFWARGQQIENSYNVAKKVIESIN